MHTRVLFFTIFTFLITIVNGQSAYWNWADAIHGPTNEDEIDALASDADANVYISGKFEDTLFLNNYNDTLISNGMADIMLVKYDSTGAMLWVQQFGGPGEDNAFDAVCDHDGNLILSGYFEQTVQFGTSTLNANGSLDAFIIKFDPNGNVIWDLTFGGSGDEGGNEVSVGHDNTIIASADGESDFSLGSFSITNSGNRDAYLISITPSGLVSWYRSIEGTGGVRSKSVAVDDWGNIYYGGDFFGNNSVIDESGSPHALNHIGNQDAYLTRWSKNGTLRWVKQWGGSGFEYCKGVATDDQGDAFVSGPFESSVSFDGVNLTSDGGIDFVLWKIDSTGNGQWIRQISSPSDVLEGGELIEDGQNGVIFGMGMEDTLNVDNVSGVEQYLLPSGGTFPILFQFDNAGAIEQTLTTSFSLYGTFGEISRSGNHIYLDVVFGGGITLGTQSFSTTPLANKDGIVANVYVPGLTSGFENFSMDYQSVSVFPNPSKTFIEVNADFDTQQKAWSIFTIDGSIVKQNLTISNNQRINIEDLTSGVYFLSNGVKTAKFVVQ